MDNSGTPAPDAYLARYYSHGHVTMQGLQGVSVADLRAGGLPSSPYASEPAGDLPELDLPNVLNPQSASDDQSYRPHPALPSADHLDYVHKLTSASLLTIGLVFVVIVLVRNPRAGGGLLAKGGLSKLGAA